MNWTLLIVLFVVAGGLTAAVSVLLDKLRGEKWMRENLMDRVTALESSLMASDKRSLEIAMEVSQQALALGNWGEAIKEFSRQQQSDRTELHARIAELREYLERRIKAVDSAAAENIKRTDEELSKIAKLEDETVLSMSNWIQEFEKRIDSAEEKLDIPKRRQVWRGPFAKGAALASQVGRAEFAERARDWNGT